MCVDSKDNVYVFNRGVHPVIAFDLHGEFWRSWGEDIGSVNAHGRRPSVPMTRSKSDRRFRRRGAQVHACKARSS